MGHCLSAHQIQVKELIQKKSKEMVELPIVSETEVITTPKTPPNTPRCKFTKGSVKAKDFMQRMRSMRK